jgi:hypothetical protein
MKSMLWPNLILVCCSIGVYCSNNNLPTNSNINVSKTISVAFTIQTNGEFNRVAKHAIMQVTAPDMDTIVQPMTMTDSNLTVLLQAVPIGNDRLFEIFVFDTAERIRYYGKQASNIEPLKTNYVYIKLLQLTSGKVVVIGTIQDSTIDSYIPINSVLGARSIDLDGNGSYDFQLFVNTDAATDSLASVRKAFIAIKGLNGNKVQNISTKGFIPQERGTFIGNNSNWSQGSANLAYREWSRIKGWDPSWSGTWVGANPMILGLALYQYPSHYFGWLSLSMDPKHGAITIHDYACEKDLGSPVRAGFHAADIKGSIPEELCGWWRSAGDDLSRAIIRRYLASGSVSEYQYHKWSSSYYFAVIRQKSICSSDSTDAISYLLHGKDSLVSRTLAPFETISYLSADTLIVDDNCADRAFTTYVRLTDQQYVIMVE